MGRTLALSMVSLVLFVASAARAQNGYRRVDDRQARLAAVFHTQHDRAESQRVLGGIALVLAGPTLALESYPFLTSSDPAFQAAGIAALSIGPIYLLLGITTLAARSRAELRWDEWQARVARGPLSATELARYEGELRQQARDEEQALVRAAVFDIGLGIAALGAGIGLGLVARDNGWLLALDGGAAALMSWTFGVINLILACVGGASEQDLRNYVQGNAPTATLRLNVVPTLSPSYGGLSMSATF